MNSLPKNPSIEIERVVDRSRNGERTDNTLRSPDLEGIAVSTATTNHASIVPLPLLHSVSTAAGLVGRQGTIEGPSRDRRVTVG